MNEEQLKEITVRILAGDARGSGFFVESGAIMTCAHVVRALPTSTRPKVLWNGQEYEAEVVKQELSSSQEGDGSVKDAAVLRIDLTAHPRSEVDSYCKTGDELHAYGYPLNKPQGEPALGRCEGTDGRGLIKFRDTLVDHGMSGSPVLNLKTGKVCGMVRATRDKDAPVGGFAIHGKDLLRILTPEPQRADIFQGLPSRLATQVDAFLVQYLGTPGNPVPFGGRDDHLNKLDDWLKDTSQPQYGLIAVRGGLGKSSLLAHWVDRLRREPHGYDLVYFPISARWQTNAKIAVFRGLAFRLASLFRESAPQSEDLRDLTELTDKYLQRAVRERKSLLLVVDGLDEATGWEAGTDFLPPRSHGNIRALVAARPLGSRDWLGRLGWNTRGVARTFDLCELDRDGIAECLRQMENPLAPLADRLDIVGTLYEKSQGDPLVVNLYVSELRKFADNSTKFDQRALEQIKPGLAGFFDYWLQDQVHLWGEDRTEREPRVRALMALCSVAHGPLQQSDVRRIAPDIFSERGAVERAAEDLQRLLVGDGRAKGYVFNHPRLADYVREEQLDDEERHGYENVFLGYCQRAVRNLQTPVEGKVPDYVVHWCSTHFIQASSSCPEFLPLLSLGWYAEWERVEGTPAGFLSDLEKIWAQAGAPEFLGIRTRIALLRSSILTRGRGISVQLFTQCLRAGVINPTLAEVIATQQESPAGRSYYLLLIAEATDPNNSRLRQEALAVARQAEDGADRAAALTAVANRLGAQDRESALQEALAAARRIEDHSDRTTALSELAEWLVAQDRESALHEALAAARRIEDHSDRSTALSAVAKWLVAQDRESALQEALAAARQIGDDSDRATALSDVAKRLIAQDVGLLQEALAVARLIRDDSGRATALSAVAQWLVAQDRESALQEALAAARQIGDDSDRATALSEVAERLTAEDVGLLQEVLAAARQIEDDSGRSRALSAVAEWLVAQDRESALQEALAVTRKIKDGSDRATPLTAVAERLSAQDVGLLQEALAVARQIEDDSDRAEVLSNVADQLSAQDRESALRDALAAARQIEDDSDRAEALSNVADQLSAQDRESALRDALAAARHIGDGSIRSRTLSAMAKRLGAQDRESAMREALAAARQVKNEFDRTRCLSAVAEQLSAQDPELLQETLAAARQIENDSARSWTLAILVDRLGTQDRETMLQEALATARRMGKDAGRAMALISVAERLGAEDRGLLQESLAAAREIARNTPRATALIGVAKRLGPEHQDLLQEALAAAREIGNAYGRARALSGVAARLGPGDREVALQEALAAAGQVDSENYSPDAALGVVAEQLGPEDRDLLQEALEAARQMMEKSYRAGALIAVAERLSAGDRETVLQEALTAARQIEDYADRAKALSAVAERLSAADRETVLQEAVAVARRTDGWDRAEALSAVAINCSVRMQADLAKDLLAVVGEEEALDGIASLAGQWLSFCRYRNSSPESELSLWLDPLSRCARSHLIPALGALAPAIEATGGPKALAEMVQAMTDAGRWWQ